MAKYIPKATIAVLFVLTILVSIIGTWIVLESISVKDVSPVQKTVGAEDKNIKFSSEGPSEPVKDNINIKVEIK